MSGAKKFPAMRAVLQLVATVVEHAGAKQITLANTNDPETVALIAGAVEEVEKAEAARATHIPVPVPQWGERPLTDNEVNSIEAMINFQAGNLGPTAYAVDEAMRHFSTWKACAI
jgi:hypothetical protein